jgi:hypothetical protein
MNRYLHRCRLVIFTLLLFIGYEARWEGAVSPAVRGSEARL